MALQPRAGRPDGREVRRARQDRAGDPRVPQAPGREPERHQHAEPGRRPLRPHPAHRRGGRLLHRRSPSSTRPRASSSRRSRSTRRSSSSIPTRLEVYEQLAELYHKQGLVNEARTQYQVLADYYHEARQRGLGDRHLPEDGGARAREPDVPRQARRDLPAAEAHREGDRGVPHHRRADDPARPAAGGGAGLRARARHRQPRTSRFIARRGAQALRDAGARRGRGPLPGRGGRAQPAGRGDRPQELRRPRHGLGRAGAASTEPEMPSAERRRSELRLEPRAERRAARLEPSCEEELDARRTT